MLMAILLAVTALRIRASLLAFTSVDDPYRTTTAKEVMADFWMPITSFESHADPLECVVVILLLLLIDEPVIELKRLVPVIGQHVFSPIIYDIDNTIVSVDSTGVSVH
jgi:hypothetical protein